MLDDAFEARQSSYQHFLEDETIRPIIFQIKQAIDGACYNGYVSVSTTFPKLPTKLSETLISYLRFKGYGVENCIVTRDGGFVESFYIKWNRRI